ncbi:hypothetical protein [Candidatus Rhabdochlamydia oedothoracis]|uniref:hypothetical protein n=1 Tax=Candidatus Rhabdochlamydia oedothoracis TaxID=2720720 RepID=UPI001C647DE3|nr:hypothetical protein [Candidatus Rhabdochlamydia oedothoracis]
MSFFSYVKDRSKSLGVTKNNYKKSLVVFWLLWQLLVLKYFISKLNLKILLFLVGFKAISKKELMFFDLLDRLPTLHKGI